MARRRVSAVYPNNRQDFLDHYRQPHKKQPTRSTTAAFGVNDQLAFMNGEWSICAVSSNVRKARYIPDLERLEVEFMDGSKYYYIVNEEIAQDFADAPSKGGFVADILRVAGGTKF